MKVLLILKGFCHISVCGLRSTSAQVGFVAKVEIMILISLIFDKTVCIMFEFW